MSVTTNYLKNGIADSLCRNTPLVVSGLYASLHDGVPGAAVDANIVACEENRAGITVAEAVAGVSTSTGGAATWVAEEAATVTYVGLHDALTAGNALGYTVVDAAQLVAEGDTVQLTTFVVEVTD